MISMAMRHLTVAQEVPVDSISMELILETFSEIFSEISLAAAEAEVPEITAP